MSTISAQSVEETESWKAEVRWWAGLAKTSITVYPVFNRRLTLIYFIHVQGDDRRAIVEWREMRSSIAKRAVTHVLRTACPGSSSTVPPGALRRLRSALHHRMEGDLADALDNLERFVEQRIGFFPGEQNGHGFGLWLLEQVLRNCPKLSEHELLKLSRSAHVSQVMTQ